MKLNNDQIQQKLVKTNQWELEDGKITRSLDFNDFKEAMAFVNKVADKAEEMDHHPDIFISYNKVELTLVTHSEGGLTDRDFAMAQKINELKS